MRHFTFCIVFFLISVEIFSQDISKPPGFYKHQIELRHDNDFLIFTDRYYTTGSYITYRNLSKKGLFKARKEQVSITLTHLYYTPTDILSGNVEEFDRPYAGYLGVTGGWFITNKTRATDLAVSFGLTGPASLAEGFQNLFHSSGGIETPSWVSQIKTGFHVNFYVGHVKEWNLIPNPFSVYFSIKPTLAIGTKDLYVEHNATFYFGRRNPFSESLAYNQLGEVSSEFFFSIFGTYRYVMHNALLEGHLIGDDSDFLVKAKDVLFLFGAEGFYRTRRNDFKIGYEYVSPESVGTKLHVYFTLSIARRF